jgi:hypothetical protein
LDDRLAQVGEAARGILAHGGELLLGLPVDRSTLGDIVSTVDATRPEAKETHTCFTTVPKKPPIRAPQGLEEKARYASCKSSFRLGCEACFFSPEDEEPPCSSG